MTPKYTDMHRVVGTVIFYKPDRTYLITKRSDKLPVHPGKWTVPGGGLETDDYINTPPTHKDHQWYNALELGIAREIKEETNIDLDIKTVEYLTNITFIRPDGKPCIVLSFFAPFSGGEIKLSHEDTDFKWVSASELQKYPLIDGIQDEIKMVDKILSSRF